MTFEVASIEFINADVDSAVNFNMYSALLTNGMWLVLEGFLYGYKSTEISVDRLHELLHKDLTVRIN